MHRSSTGESSVVHRSQTGENYRYVRVSDHSTQSQQSSNQNTSHQESSNPPPTDHHQLIGPHEPVQQHNPITRDDYPNRQPLKPTKDANGNRSVDIGGISYRMESKGGKLTFVSPTGQQISQESMFRAQKGYNTEQLIPVRQAREQEEEAAMQEGAQQHSADSNENLPLHNDVLFQGIGLVIDYFTGLPITDGLEMILNNTATRPSSTQIRNTYMH